jgi:hypothetical protein
VRVQLITLGLKVAPVMRLKAIDAVVPVAVWTVIPEVFGVPDGTVVTM